MVNYCVFLLATWKKINECILWQMSVQSRPILDVSFTQTPSAVVDDWLLHSVYQFQGWHILLSTREIDGWLLYINTYNPPAPMLPIFPRIQGEFPNYLAASTQLLLPPPTQPALLLLLLLLLHTPLLQIADDAAVSPLLVLAFPEVKTSRSPRPFTCAWPRQRWWWLWRPNQHRPRRCL